MLYKWINWLFQKRNFATILLVLFLTQIVFVEGYTISYVKVGVMALCPVLMFFYRIPITRAMVLCTVYYVYIVLTASFHPDTFRASTLIYLLLFLLMYVLFYSLVHTGAFSLQYFIRGVKYLIFAYCICLILQQICFLIGIRFFPLINLNRQFFLGINKLPSLAIEPSHSARILGVLFYAYLKCNEFCAGTKLSILSVFSPEHRWVTIAFLWSMLTMGSGTAFICMGVLSLYFMKGFQFLYAIPIFVSIYFILNFFEVQQFQRAVVTAQATMTGDAHEIAKADGSALVRIKPLLNTLSLDLSDPASWFGKGCDASLSNGLYGDNRYLSEIGDYGLIAYILGLILVFSCSIKPLSLGTLMLFMGIGGGTGNIYYGWGILMIFTCIHYFFKIKTIETDKVDTIIA